MKIRADVLKKSVCKAKVSETAFGSCVIAAGGVHYENLTEAIEHMARIDKVFEPDSGEAVLYDDIYEKFVAECSNRGFF